MVGRIPTPLSHSSIPYPPTPSLRHPCTHTFTPVYASPSSRVEFLSLSLVSLLAHGVYIIGSDLYTIYIYTYTYA